jgi:acetoin utilization deacetylase AcuC-like enzyme
MLVPRSGALAWTVACNTVAMAHAWAPALTRLLAPPGGSCLLRRPPALAAASRRCVSLPRLHAAASEEEVRARTAADLAPSYLVQALLSWTPRKPAPCAAVPPVPVLFHTGYGYEEWETSHRFVMSKFHGVMKQIRTLEASRPRLHDSFRVVSDFEPIARSLVERVHSSTYVEAFCSGTLDSKALRKIGLPWSRNLVRRTLLECEGTRLAALLALQEGLACNTGGGTHHAFASHGSGFTIFNDLAVTAQWLIDTEALGVKQVLILDLDVHQGDGTAAIFAEQREVYTVSMHCESNFPFQKQVSDLDISLPDGTADKEYLQEVARRLPRILEDVRPDLVLYDAGVDVHEEDVLGKLALTDQGIFDRDYYVLRACAAFGVPVATVVGGGYDKNHELLAWRHSIVFQAAAAARAWGHTPPPPPGAPRDRSH